MIDWAVIVAEKLITGYGPFGVFVASFIQEVITVVPSSLIILFSSFAVLHSEPLSFNSAGILLFHMAIPVAFGLTCGSLFLYGIVYYMGEPFIHKFGKYIGISWGDIEKFQSMMNTTRVDDALFLVMRSIPVIPFSAINAFCGLVRWPLKNYLIITFLGALIRALTVGIIGWQLGLIYSKNTDIFARFEKVILLFMVLSAIGFVYYRRRKKQEKAK